MKTAPSPNDICVSYHRISTYIVLRAAECGSRHAMPVEVCARCRPANQTREPPDLQAALNWGAQAAPESGNHEIRDPRARIRPPGCCSCGRTRGGLAAAAARGGPHRGRAGPARPGGLFWYQSGGRNCARRRATVRGGGGVRGPPRPAGSAAQRATRAARGAMPFRGTPPEEQLLPTRRAPASPVTPVTAPPPVVKVRAFDRTTPSLSPAPIAVGAAVLLPAPWPLPPPPGRAAPVDPPPPPPIPLSSSSPRWHYPPPC